MHAKVVNENLTFHFPLKQTRFHPHLHQIITEPDPVVVTAQITSEITCNVATATITATTATGGTPGYTYQLEDISGIPIAGYEFATNGTNRVFSNLPIGDYIVTKNS